MMLLGYFAGAWQSNAPVASQPPTNSRRFWLASYTMVPSLISSGIEFVIEDQARVESSSFRTPL